MDSDLKDYKMNKLREGNNPRGNFLFSPMGMIIFGICLILIAVFINADSVMSDDYYWHVSVGEWIVQHKEIPMTGLFSWTAADTPWFAHEWLAEVVMYGFHSIDETFGGWIYYVLSMVLMYTMIYFMNKKEINRNSLMGLFAWILLIFATNQVNSARPHALSISFFIYLIYSLEQLRKNEKSKLIYFTPLVSLIWANYHGGTVMFVPIMFLIYICSSLFNFNFMKLQGTKLSKKQILTMVIMLVVNMLTICINPHGVSLITYPFSYSNIATKYVGEWQSPSLASFPFVIFLIIFVCIILFLTKKRLQFTDLGVLGTLMVMTLKYVRFEWWLAIVIIFYLLKYIPFYNVVKYKTLTCLSLSTLMIGTILLLLPTYTMGISANNHFTEAVAKIESVEYKNMYNSYNFGNYLIYNGYDVFLDGRSDMYQHVLSEDIYQDKDSETYDKDKQISVLEEAMEFESYNLENMQAFIDKYDLDLFVISKKVRANYYLKNCEDIELIYEDENLNIYHKTS